MARIASAHRSNRPPADFAGDLQQLMGQLGGYQRRRSTGPLLIDRAYEAERRRTAGAKPRSALHALVRGVVALIVTLALFGGGVAALVQPTSAFAAADRPVLLA